MKTRIKLFMLMATMCVLSSIYFDKNLSVEQQSKKIEIQSMHKTYSENDNKNVVRNKSYVSINNLKKASNISTINLQNKSNYDNEWMKRMEEKYRETNERIKSACAKYRYKKSYVPRPQYYLHHMLDLRHNLGYCPQYKVGTSTMSKHFLRLMPQNRRPKTDDYWNKAMIEYFKVPIDYDRFRHHKHISRDIKNWFLNFVRPRKLMLFSFVRHPFERLVSAYKEKFVMTSILDEKGQEERLKEFFFFKTNPKYREWYKKDHSFSSFVELVLKEYSQSRQLSWPWKINGHWTPMSMRCFYCDVRYDVIGRMETFSDDLKYIIMKNKLGDILSEDKKVRTTGGSPKDDALRYFSQLRKEQIRSLYEVYKMDFKLFGYNVDEYLK